MAEIIGIRFKREGKQYYFDPLGIQVAPGQGVILETSWGTEFGECVRGNSQVPDSELVAPLRPIIRLATPADYETVRKNREKEASAASICQQKIQEHGLDMKLVDVEYSFEGNKILFFFTSEGRVDFRGLVKDLASIFHTRIELRQIGVRDEAKMLGGLGICGRPFCCASFLRDFQPVSIKMAKTQGLSLNPTKISGTCGRLMCCLKYEQDAYEDLLKNSPRADSFVETPDGVGDIISVNTLREKVRVRLDSAPDGIKVYHNSEIRIVRNGKGKRPEDYRPPAPEELAKLRRVQPGAAEVSGEDGLSPTLRRFLAEEPPAQQPPQKKDGARGGQTGEQEKKPGGKGRSRSRGGRDEKKPASASGIQPGKKAESGNSPQRERTEKGSGHQRSGGKPLVQSAPVGQAGEKAAPVPENGEKKARPPWRKRPSARRGKKTPQPGAGES